MNYEKLHTYFKTRVVDGIYWWIFFVINDMDIFQLNLGPFGSLNFFVEKSLKIVFFFSNNKGEKNIQGKKIPNER